MQTSACVIGLLAALVGLCAAYPYCDSKLDEKDCFTCCRSYKFRSALKLSDGSCECSQDNQGPCPDPKTESACQFCCQTRYNYKNYNWDWDFSDCTCADKRQARNRTIGDRGEPKGVKQRCSTAKSYTGCVGCCQDTNHKSFKWDWDQNTCTCLKKRPERPQQPRQQMQPGKQFCMQAQNHSACMDCCKDTKYPKFDWDVVRLNCTCLPDKRKKQRQPKQQPQQQTLEQQQQAYQLYQQQYQQYQQQYQQYLQQHQEYSRQVELAKSKNPCSYAGHPDDCTNCCEATNHIGSIWDSYANSCSCSNTVEDYNAPFKQQQQQQQLQQQEGQQHQPPAQPKEYTNVTSKDCPDATLHYGGCAQCCKDLRYQTAKWDSEEYTCRCADKLPDKPKVVSPCPEAIHYGECAQCCRDLKFLTARFSEDHVCTCKDKEWW